MKKIVEIAPSGTNKATLARLEVAQKEQFEKQKDEMMGTLKDFGNTILGKFGMSTVSALPFRQRLTVGGVVVVVGGGGSDGRPSSLNFKPWAHVGQLPDAGAAGRRLLRQLRQQPPAGSEVTMWCA